MTFLSKILKCHQCKNDAATFVLEYNTISRRNEKKWYCMSHKPDYDVTYIPKDEFGGHYKKFVNLHGINHVKSCNQDGMI